MKFCVKGNVNLEISKKSEFGIEFKITDEGCGMD